MSRDTSRILLITAAVIVGLCGVAYLGVILGRRSTERKNMEYLARVGGVPDTYEAVEAYMNREFTPGMTEDEVVALLDRRFTYRFRDKGSNQRTAFSYIVMFPTADCEPGEFESGYCHPVHFRFDFERGRLVRVKLEDSI
jgi:hypothetical protein